MTPLQKQKNYQQTFELACATFRGMDLQERAKAAGAHYLGDSGNERIRLSCFSEPYEVRFPEVSFHSPGKKVISLVTRILILHYLIKADGTPLTGKWVPYKEVPGGMLYAPVFSRRVTEPLVKGFGRSAEAFREAGLKVGAALCEIGDGSFILQALPRVPLQYILWEGDEEFPPSVQLLFDSSVEHYLSLEDMVVLGQMATGRLLEKGGLTKIGTREP